MNDTGEEEIGFGGQYVGGFTVGNAESVFQRVNRALHTGAAVVNLSESGIIARNARIEAQILVERNINAAAVFGWSAGTIALAAKAALSIREFHQF